MGFDYSYSYENRVGDFHITGNYKATVNPPIIVDEHPIPKI